MQTAFYGHHTGQPVFAGSSDFYEQDFLPLNHQRESIHGYTKQ